MIPQNLEYPVSSTVTTGGNILVIDKDHEKRQGKMVVLNPKFEAIGRYNGDSRVNMYTYQFNPTCLVTTLSLPILIRTVFIS